MAGRHFKSNSTPQGETPRQTRPSGSQGTGPSPDSTAAFIRAFNDGIRTAQDGGEPAQRPADGAPTVPAAPAPSAAPAAPAPVPDPTPAASPAEGAAAQPKPDDAPAQAAPESTEATPEPRTSKRAGFTASFPAQRENVQYYDFGGTVPTKDDPNLVRKRKRRRHHGKKTAIIVAAVIAALVIVIGACAFALYRSAQSVTADAKQAAAIASALPDKMLKGSDDLTSQVDELTGLTTRMNSELSSPLWAIASAMPAFGGDVSAARELVSVMDDTAQNALAPMAADLSKTPLNTLVQDGGTVDVAALQNLVNTTAKVSKTLHAANARVQAIGGTNIAQVTDLVQKAKTGFSTLDGAASTAQKVAPVLPQMLGVGGPRTYLIVAENNAEIRTLGGFSGATGVLTMDNGHITLDTFEPTQTLAKSGGPTDKISISNEEFALFQPYGTTLNYTAGDAFFVPDFPRGSDLTRTIWAINHEGQMASGVIAADPTFVQYLLQVTGGVTASDGEKVDGTNAAKVLLSDVYWKYPTDGKAQDAVFASVASATFDKLLGNLGSIDLKKLGAAVARGVSEGRLLAWSENADEEAAFNELGIAGALPTDPAKPQTGVYVNNYSFSKLDYYLDLNATRGDAVQNPDGTVSYAMRVDMKNTMSAEEEANLPAYVKANNGTAASKSQEILYLYLYAPAGGKVSDVKLSNGVSLKEGTHKGLQVMYNEVRMKPGESIQVTYTVTVPKEGADQDLKVKVTPTAQAARDGSAAQPADASTQE